MDTMVAETRVTLDTRLHSKNIIVLSLEVTNDFAEASMMSATVPLNLKNLCVLPCLVVNLVPKARCIYDCEGNTSSLFIQFQLFGGISNPDLEL